MQIRKKNGGNGPSLRDTGQNVSIDLYWKVQESSKNDCFSVHFGVYLRMGHCDICIKMVCYVKLPREFEYDVKSRGNGPQKRDMG